MIEGKTACWNHAMDMRMVQDRLTPTVKHAHKADLSTEVLWDPQLFPAELRR